MNKASIYILDDEPDMLLLLEDIVDDANLSSKCFSKAKDFFQNITQPEENTLLVLDLNMPEMDGIEVMRRLAKMQNPPSLILISGHDIGILHSAEKLGRAHNLNILGSLDKPVDLHIFQKLLKQHQNSIKNTNPIKPQRSNSIHSPDELLHAINNNQLVLHYQPKIEIKTGRMVSCEALVRWQHPQQGLIFPDNFISIAEKNNWMSLLTNWVIKHAVKQSQQWETEGFHLPISVNISASDITTLSLPEQISTLLTEKKLNPVMLTLEVTESALMGELVTSLYILTRLRLKGIGLSIDDFGTGYSSLSQLHRIPFSELKIDQSFIGAMLEDNEAKAIVKTCIMLGHELKMKVVAEGVELREHFELLKELGCDIAQGYLFSRPVPPENLRQYATGLE